jgi:TolB protein
MRVFLVVLSLVLVSCGAEDPSTTTTVVTPPGAVESTTTTGATALPGTTSTSEAATTTTLGSTTTTTTAPVATVTVDPYLPAAMSRDSIPWADVGFGWYVVLYDSSKAAPTGPGDVREGPVVLYLVAPDGTRYETASWAPDARPWRIVDVRSDGTAAIVQGSAATPDDNEWVLVDLPTGVMQTVHEASFPEVTYGWGSYVKLTKPTGTNVVVYRSDGVDEWLERRSPGGSLLATLYQQTYVDWVGSLRWMYGHDGTTALVTHHGGIALIQNDGTPIRELWVPMDHVCEPVRWWDADTFLATCYGQGPGSAPLDEYGNPHTFYGRLWLLEIDGTAGAPLTEYPADPPFVGDFGYSDAWPSGPDTLLQWTGDCGAAQIAALQADGTGTFIPISVPSSIVADGVGMVHVNVVSGLITVYAWQGCAGDVGALFLTDLSGAFVQELVPVIGDARSVISVRSLAEVYP